jgi:NADPH:quinone reductase-like Zn-dependent oxidoreductase
MSRTIRFHKFGPAEVLKCEEHAAALPAPGEVQVRVEAIGISWYDILWRQNLAPSQARLPSGLGHEMAGVVTAVGEGVDDLAVGDKVASFPAESPNDYPVYGEQIVLPRSALTRYPDVLSPIEASVHYTPLLIAYFAYVDLARVKPGNLRWSPTPAIAPARPSCNWARPWGAGDCRDQNREEREYLLSLGAEK